EQKPAAEIAEAESRHERERPLDPLAEAWQQQRQREDAEEHGADLDLVLLADSEQSPEPRAGEQEGSERRHEAGGDRIRPPSRARPACEDDWQYGQDAGR